MSTTPGPADPTTDALAEAAWWHLVNRHDLAQALDELAATEGPDQLQHAITYVTGRPREIHLQRRSLSEELDQA